MPLGMGFIYLVVDKMAGGLFCERNKQFVVALRVQATKRAD